MSAAKLSPMNQLAASLLCGGGGRLFLAADACDTSGTKAESDHRQAQHVEGLLSETQHIKTLSSKAQPAAASSVAAVALPEAAWTPCQQFLQQVDQRRQAEQQRQAEAAALSQAEAGRREKLHRAVTQRRHQGSKPAAACTGQRCEEHAQPRLAQSPSQAPHPSEHSSSPRLAAYRPASYTPPRTSLAAAAAVAAGTASAGNPEQHSGEGTGNLNQLEEQFDQGLAGQGQTSGRLPAAASSSSSSSAAGSPAACRQQVAPPHASLAAGVAAADDVCLHMAALRMRAAADAVHADKAQHVQHQAGFRQAPAPAASQAAPTGSRDGPPAFNWGGHLGGGEGGGSKHQLGQQPVWQAAEQAAGAGAPLAATPAAARPCQHSPGSEHYELADESLADLDEPAPSLGSLFRRPISRLAGNACSSSTSADAGLHFHSTSGGGLDAATGRRGAAAAEDGSQAGPAGVPATGARLEGMTPPVQWAAADPGASADLTPMSNLVSDFFKSDLAAPSQLHSLPECQPEGPGAVPAAELAHANGETSAADGFAAPLAPAGRYAAVMSDSSGTASGSESGACAASARVQPGDEEVWQRGGSGGQYAAARWEQEADCGAAVASPVTMNQSVGSSRPCAQQQGLSTPAGPALDCLRGSPTQQAAEVSALLAELEREQRINATLLRQLHELQQQVEEAVVSAAAASAAAAQPLAPGASDPAGFNGLLAALQTVRQQHAALHNKMQLQQQQAEEQRLALEAQMHTQERQLAVAAAR